MHKISYAIILFLLLAFATGCGVGDVRDGATLSTITLPYQALPRQPRIEEPVMAPKPYVPTPEPVFTAEPIPPHIAQQIMGSSFHPHTPFGMEELAYLTLTHVNFEGERTEGHMIVAAAIAEEVLDIFRDIYAAQFPIARIRLIDYYNALDYYSMADNNSVGFNFRTIAGTNVISRHGLGMAIDINPIQNPYIRGNTIWPAAGVDYVDRTNVRPGMIIPGDAVYTAFISRGWIWGGHWTSPIDYHHFERR